jgi:hypothetical protein
MTTEHPTAEDLTALYEQYATLIRPTITRTDDNRWRAQLPSVSWHVTADTEDAAGDAISTEALRRLDAGEPEPQPPHDLLLRHLRHPIPGVYAMDRELFLHVRTNAGVTATQRAFEEAERRRAAGQSYTKSDYISENGPATE